MQQNATPGYKGLNKFYRLIVDFGVDSRGLRPAYKGPGSDGFELWIQWIHIDPQFKTVRS